MELIAENLLPASIVEFVEKGVNLVRSAYHSQSLDFFPHFAKWVKNFILQNCQRLRNVGQGKRGCKIMVFLNTFNLIRILNSKLHVKDS